MNFADQNVVVVGAAGALGSKLTSALLESGANVIGTASSAESLAKINPQVTEKYLVDLTDPASIQAFTKSLISAHQKISGVVIASGVVGFGVSESISAADSAKIMQINYLGPSQLINELFPILKSEGTDETFVLGISGIVVEQIFPGMGAYSSSKAAFSAYLQTITKEWRRYKIKVTEARLGHTETGLANRAIFGSAPQMPTGLDPAEVIKVMLDAVAEKKPVINSAEFN
jgi:cyclic-di-GMP-binding biofilm dispersal mediator protein